MSSPMDGKQFLADSFSLNSCFTATTHTHCIEGFKYQLIFNIKIWSRRHADTKVEEKATRLP